MTVIALCGFRGSGKDTVANILITEYGFVKKSFASALKDTLAAIFGWDRYMLDGLTPEHRYQRAEIDEWWANALNIPQLSPLFAMTEIGTRVFRESFHTNIWVKSLEHNLRAVPNQNIVITDCRFPNEFEMMRTLNAHIIEIHRNTMQHAKKYQITQRDTIDSLCIEYGVHKSEIYWLKEVCNKSIINDGTLDSLTETVNDLVVSICNEV